MTIRTPACSCVIRICCLTLLFLFQILITAPAYAKISQSLQIIFDASGSMNEEWDGAIKLDLAKSALLKALKYVDFASTRISLRAFGFNQKLHAENKSCINTEIMMRFENANLDFIQRASSELTAHGKTPIARSLSLAGRDLERFKEDKPTILLITDGRETCGGDPLKVIRQMRNSGLEIRVHVIGLDVDGASRDELQAIAEAGNGHYYDARTGSSLTDSLSQFVAGIQDEVDVQRGLELQEMKAVSGGENLQKAKRLRRGKYRLADVMPRGKETFFKARSKASQTIEIGGELDFVQNALPGQTDAFRIQVYDAKGKRVIGRHIEISSRDTSERYLRYVNLSGEAVFFSISSQHSEVPRNARLSVRILQTGDKNSSKDAPSDPKSGVLNMSFRRGVSGFLGMEDKGDAYQMRIPSPSPRQLEFRVAFEDPSFQFKVVIYNGDTQSTLKSYSQSIGKTILRLPTPTCKKIWIQILDINGVYANRHSAYDIDVQ